MENPGSNHYNHHQLKSSKKPNKVKKKPIKVTYISSPMLVRANSASEFRAIVQELTGQNSDAFMAIGGGEEASPVVDNGTPTANTKAEFEDAIGELGFSNMVSSLEPNEASFWREVSESFLGFQFPCVLV